MAIGLRSTAFALQPWKAARVAFMVEEWHTIRTRSHGGGRADCGVGSAPYRQLPLAPGQEKSRVSMIRKLAGNHSVQTFSEPGHERQRKTLDRDPTRLGQPLILRHGDVTAVLDELHRATRFTTLWSHEETVNGCSFSRGQRVAAWARDRAVEWVEWPQNGVIRGLRSRGGRARRWERRKPVVRPVCRSVWKVRQAPSRVRPLSTGPG